MSIRLGGTFYDLLRKEHRKGIYLEGMPLPWRETILFMKQDARLTNILRRMTPEEFQSSGEIDQGIKILVDSLIEMIRSKTLTLEQRVVLGIFVKAELSDFGSEFKLGSIIAEALGQSS